MPANPYDAIPYATFPRLETHPDRLATVGTLFGMTPAPVTRCRVLEIGCGTGNNLIPMAYWLPGSSFTGIDLAAEPIAAGLRAIASLRLGNIALREGDLRDLGPADGEFDYILAHGIYSWVPQEVRDRLLGACRELLAPQGIAFISYNAYPGRHVRIMLREMMFYHARNCADTASRIREARWFLEFFRKSRVLAQAWAEVLEGEAKTLLEHGEGGLFHDDLADINESFYFRDFAEHARRHRLQYLGEASLHEMFDHNAALDWLKDDLLEREQYLDFLKLRRFRQTLLCREEIALDRRPGPALMQRFLFSAPARTVEGGQIEGLRGIRISSAHEAVGRVAAALGETYPLPLSFEELAPYAGEHGALGEILFALVTGGFANLHVHDFPCEDTVTAHPRASRLALYQGMGSRYVTSACHHVIELDEIGRRLLPLLDGAHTHQDIARALAAGSGAMPEQILEHLPRSLEWFAREGLLEG